MSFVRGDCSSSSGGSFLLLLQVHVIAAPRVATTPGASAAPRMAAKGASICGAIKFSIVPTIIRHVAADHVGIPAIIASAVRHVATDHICIPINVRASGFVVMIVVDVDNGRTLHRNGHVQRAPSHESRRSW